MCARPAGCLHVNYVSSIFGFRGAEALLRRCSAISHYAYLSQEMNWWNQCAISQKKIRLSEPPPKRVGSSSDLGLLRGILHYTFDFLDTGTSGSPASSIRLEASGRISSL